MAVGFTALANTLLLATCVFTEWMPTRQILLGTGLLALVWLVSWWRSHLEFRRSGNRQFIGESLDDEPTDDTAVALEREVGEQLFRDAQRFYLAGDWVATEQLLLKLLKQDARDVEGRLMLATLWRRQGRYGEATRQLDKLARLEAADQWQNEIEAERHQIATATTENQQILDENDQIEHTTDISIAQQETNNETNRRLAA